MTINDMDSVGLMQRLLDELCRPGVLAEIEPYVDTITRADALFIRVRCGNMLSSWYIKGSPGSCAGVVERE